MEAKILMFAVLDFSRMTVVVQYIKILDFSRVKDSRCAVYEN